MADTLIDTYIQKTYNSCMSSKTINLSLPAELLRALDKAAKANYATRSDFIRESIVMRLKGQRIVKDEWGDEGRWETVLDVRKHGYPDGIPFDEVVEILERLEKRDQQKRKTPRQARK